MSSLTATYSPEDNKLRLYCVTRLDTETYQRVSDAGFRFAAKQDLFVAPAWTPEREDLLLELCGEIDPEETSVADRAEDRAQRFKGYSDRRLQESQRAHAQVHAITEHIPLGQPILVGHHSERRARRDVQRITDGMRRAVEAAETAKYWDWRALGAARHARMKSDPAVRHRRIRTLEADERKQQRIVSEADAAIAMWSKPDLSHEAALAVANVAGVSHSFPLAEYPRALPASQYEGPMSLWSALEHGVVDVATAKQIALDKFRRTRVRAQRYCDHYAGRVAYERAQLDDQGGHSGDKFDFAVGGSIFFQGEWVKIMRVNRSGGKIVSLTTAAPSRMYWRDTWKVSVEEVSQYHAPSSDEAAAAKAPPIVNIPVDGCLAMTWAEYGALHTDYRGVRLEKATASRAAYRYRVAMKHGALHQVYISDRRRVDMPALTVKEEPCPA